MGLPLGSSDFRLFGQSSELVHIVVFTYKLINRIRTTFSEHTSISTVRSKFDELLAFNSDECHQITTCRYSNGVQPPVPLSISASNKAQPHQSRHELLYMDCLLSFYLFSSFPPSILFACSHRLESCWGAWHLRAAIVFVGSTQFYLSLDNQI
jgi:hypothetical protein